MGKYIGFLAALCGLSACAFDSGPAPGRAFVSAPLAPPPIDYAALVAHPDRPLDDFSSDASRHPSEVLAFMDVGYGMTVVELEAGGGYYTELFSRAVTDTGKVYMHNPKEFDAFLGDSLDKRFEDGRLSNVEMMRTPFDEIRVPDSSADLVTWVLGPHELWFTPDGSEVEALGDPEGAFMEISRVLKTGGTFVALDHSAPKGSSTETGGTTHRIDPDIIIRMAEASGLTFVDTSDLLANPDDDLETYVLDPEIRRKTDRFLLKFRK
ncbi:MAG: class I SAM-dependent methyltransferase [Pseudomonadota bacterium]